METMTVQQFFTLLQQLAQYLIPVILFIILVHIMRILHKLVGVVDEAKHRVAQLEKTITLVDENLESLTTTTKSIANVATSVDEAHVKSKAKMGELSNKLQSKILKVQEKGKSILEKVQQKNNQSEE